MHSKWIGRYLRTDALKQRLSELERELAPLIEERDELLAFLELYNQGAEGPDRHQEAACDPVATPAKAAGLRLGGESLAIAALGVFRGPTETLATIEVMNRLAKQGIEPRGDNPVQTLYAALHRVRDTHSELTKSGRGVWTVARPEIETGGADQT
jgi:hypothetical protein